MAKVYVSSVINAPAAKVWAMVRDFNGLPKWTPFVASSEIEGGHPSDKVGCIRNFLLKDGGRIRETLLSLSDKDMSMTYDIIVSPMGVTNYLATLSVAPVTMTGQAFVLWTAEFDAEEKREAELVEHIGTNVFAAAFANLNAMMK
jgi:hypothetical protein